MSEPVSDPDKAAQDAAWQEIVENFGDRVELSGDDLAQPEPVELLFDDDVDEPFDPDPEMYDEDYDDGFVAPSPTLPRPSPDRLLAWIGVLGTPVAAIVLVVLHMTLGWWIPNWVVDFLILGFLVGFGYLVFHMPREPRDPWDDGARL
ncbi:AtpZ/AtpI family protein [Nocardioides sp. Iso805N]|uniref:AtpZ/AtpI family protein n=1 Tax=Nocardioides sp. Iso805N TaxID=1283287 RepID=UPI000367C047|nr:AtpZ/AtpI family protein [Nocardioides sp. Iso805N]